MGRPATVGDWKPRASSSDPDDVLARLSYAADSGYAACVTSMGWNSVDGDSVGSRRGLRRANPDPVGQHLAGAPITDQKSRSPPEPTMARELQLQQKVAFLGALTLGRRLQCNPTSPVASGARPASNERLKNPSCGDAETRVS
jgi:hypothetical protein